MPNYDNADLGIVALFLLGLAAILTGYIEQGSISMIIGAIAGISRPNGDKKL
jgi:hypothetical protein